MRENRQAVFDAIFKWEGEEVTLGPSEPGGASKYGISVDFLTDYRKKHGLSHARVDDVEMLTKEDAIKIYGETLLDPLRFDELPLGVDYTVADISANLGMTGGPTLVQLCLGMYPLTGTMDNATVAAVKAYDPKILVHKLRAAWITKKHEAPGWFSSPNAPHGFGKGWTRRNNDAENVGVAMVGD